VPAGSSQTLVRLARALSALPRRWSSSMSGRPMAAPLAVRGSGVRHSPLPASLQRLANGRHHLYSKHVLWALEPAAAAGVPLQTASNDFAG
jgi:hypothetical protein